MMSLQVWPNATPTMPNQMPMRPPMMDPRMQNQMMMAQRGNPMMNRGMMSMQQPRIMAQEGGMMDMGGMEKDYRNEGGFVPMVEVKKEQMMYQQDYLKMSLYLQQMLLEMQEAEI